MEEGLKASGKLMLLVGAGGALGRMIQDSGLGDYIAGNIVKTSISPLLLPFLIALLLRVAQGSGSVAMMTAASVTAPMVTALQLNPVFAALAACIGAIPFSHFNDSYFWVVTNFGAMTPEKGYKTQTMATLVLGLSGMLEIFILSLFLH